MLVQHSTALHAVFCGRMTHRWGLTGNCSWVPFMPTSQGSPSVKKWMDAHSMNASGLGRYFWQQLTKQVLPSLNR
jgi:hypothetical protein